MHSITYQPLSLLLNGKCLSVKTAERESLAKTEANLEHEKLLPTVKQLQVADARQLFGADRVNTNKPSEFSA